MADLVRGELLRGAQQQIVILRPVDAGVQGAHRIQHVAAQHHQVTEVIQRQEQIRIEVRLEERRVMNQPAKRVLLDAVLVRVHQSIAVLLQRAHHFVQRLGREQIVVIQEGDVLAARRGDAAIGVAGDAGALAGLEYAQALIGMAAQQRPKGLARRRGIVGDDEFEMIIALLADAAQRGIEQP